MRYAGVQLITNSLSNQQIAESLHIVTPTVNSQ
jgi:hypothetical protein